MLPILNASDANGEFEMRSFRYRLIATLAVLVTVSMFMVTRVNAQERSDLKAADTSSPRDTLKSFIDACNEVHELVKRERYLDRDAPEHAHLIMQIRDCLDVSELPDFAREQSTSEAAVCIKEILDRVKLPPWETIPDLAMIEAKGGFEKLSRWRIPGTRITIARVEEGPQKHEYLFSDGTVARAVEYFKQIESKPYRTPGQGPQVSEDLYQWYLSSPYW
jgi:MscS family membrane protein